MFFNPCVFACEKLIYCLFLGPFTPKMNIMRLAFNCKYEAIQVVNFKPRMPKITPTTLKILSISIYEAIM
jgi:predicted glycosyltransferase